MTETDINAMALDLAVRCCGESCNSGTVLNVAAKFRAFIISGA